MGYGSESNVIVVRLNDGEEILSSIEKIAEENEINSGIVMMGIGMLRDFVLGYFDGNEYQRTKNQQPHELVSLQGSLAKCEQEMIVHLHGNLADNTNNTIGGHIFEGTVAGLAEITIKKLESLSLYRELNEKTGLKELHIK